MTPSGSNSGVSPNDTSEETVPVAKNASSPPDGLEIPKNILVFRTITTLLAKIQHEKPLEYSNEPESGLDNSEKKELRTLTAFANVANTQADIDVIAIAANLSMDKLEVIACANRDNNELIDHPLLLPSKISGILEFLFTSNPRGHTGKDQMPYIDHSSHLKLLMFRYSSLPKFLVIASALLARLFCGLVTAVARISIRPIQSLQTLGSVVFNKPTGGSCGT
jgi:hypothetical protein